MNFSEVENKLEIALKSLRENDRFLLQNDVNERSIAHKLALYLTPLFPDYDVDCEYNSNVEADSRRKYIYLLKSTAEKYGLFQENEKDAEIVYRKVFPDIIVHKRGSNEHNLLILELKKSSSRNHDYDIEKLKRYTSPANENTFNYSFGVFVYLGVADELGKDRITWFQNGNKTN